ncbi:MAG: chemotaxis protein CheA, partial [Chloroflexi bacterium]|nr:chemotaxis protein CheA [Chloroflexota bacterium]
MELASDITSEDIQAFLQEAEEQLQLLDEDIVRLEREQDTPELLQEIFRAAHTLKGSSAMLGHRRMTEMAHAMETVLDKVRHGSLMVTTPVVDALLHSLDALTLLKEELISSDVSDVDIAATVAELERAAESESDTASSQGSDEAATDIRLDQESQTKLKSLLASGLYAYKVTVTLSRETSWAAVRCFQLLESLSNAGEVLASLPTQEDVEAERVGSDFRAIVAGQINEEDLKGVLQQVEDVTSVEIGLYVQEPASLETFDREAASLEAASLVAAPTGDTGHKQQNQKAQTVRIDVERLDHLMNMIGELVIDRTRIVQIGKALEAKYRDDDLIDALGKTSSHIEKVVDELQESTMKVRMLPIGTVLSGFPRMIRDLSLKIGKQVEFLVDGQDTEIDRTVVDRIRDPLVHLLRNSVDHGLETPEERRAAGKPEMGTLKLSAAHEQGHIVITVEDDGRGIDPRKIKDSAISKGLLSSEAASRLSDAEALDLIFLPGFSTVEKTTEVSGRGVGMDIVKSNIETINGFVNLSTKVGEGTKFSLRLPLTLATLQALLVNVADTTYAIPVVYLLETVVRKRDEINIVDGGEVIRLREKVIPLVRLSNVLGIAKEGAEEGENSWIVVVHVGERLIGLGVESLVELQEIVVKSLGRYIGDIKGVAGASVLGDGTVVLILDVPTLVNLVMQR